MRFYKTSESCVEVQRQRQLKVKPPHRWSRLTVSLLQMGLIITLTAACDQPPVSTTKTAEDETTRPRVKSPHVPAHTSAKSPNASDLLEAHQQGSRLIQEALEQAWMVEPRLGPESEDRIERRQQLLEAIHRRFEKNKEQFPLIVAYLNSQEDMEWVKYQKGSTFLMFKLRGAPRFSIASVHYSQEMP